MVLRVFLDGVTQLIRQIRLRYVCSSSQRRGGREVVYKRAKISKNEITKAKHQWGSVRESDRESDRERERGN